MLDLRLAINLFALAGCLFAFWKGGPAERWAALAVIVNVAIGQTGHYIAPALNTEIRLVNDGLTALIMLGITVRFAALWMGGVMLFYAAQFSMHSFYLVAQRERDFLYVLINNIDFTSIIWCLIIGTAVAWRRRVRTARLAAERAAT